MSARRRLPWYRTLGGKAVAGITVLALLSLLVGLVVNARTSGDLLADRQEAIQSYSGEIRALLQRVVPPAGELAALGSLPGNRILREVEDGGPAWVENFEAAITDAEAIAPPAEVAPAHGLFVDSIRLYSGAAQTYALAPELEGRVQSDIFIRASEQRARAESVWANAVAVLDGQLAEVEAEPSGLSAPSAGGPARVPPPDAKESTGPGDGADD